MGKGKKLLIALAALIVLIGGFFAVKYLVADDSSAAEDGSGVSVTEQPSIVIGTLVEADIDKISYTYDDEKVELVKKDDTWHSAGDNEFPVNQTLVQTMTSNIATLSAKRLVAESSDVFDEYGLTDRTNAYTVSAGDTTVVYVIGNYNSFSDAYYLNIDGEQRVYLVASSFVECFKYGLSGLAQVDDTPVISTGDITSMSVKTENNELSISQYPEGLDSCYSTTYTWFTGNKTELDTTKVTSFAGSVVGFTSLGCADYSADDEELKKYGLDKPVATVTIDYNETTSEPTGELDDNGDEILDTTSEKKQLVLNIGGFETKDVSRYARFNDSKVIYLLDNEYYTTLDTSVIDTLCPMDVCMLTIDTVNTMTVTIDGKKSVINIKRVKSNEEGASDTVDYTLDDKLTTAAYCNDFFSAIQGMQAEKMSDKAVTAEPYITVVFDRNTDKFEQMTLKFIPYDSSFYLVEFNGMSRLLANKLDVENVVEKFEAIQTY